MNGQLASIIATLAGLVSAATLLIIAARLGKYFGALQGAVKALQDTVHEHANRLNRSEEVLMKIVSEMQRVVGRIETVQERIDRWNGTAGIGQVLLLLLAVLTFVGGVAGAYLIQVLINEAGW